MTTHQALDCSATDDVGVLFEYVFKSLGIMLARIMPTTHTVMVLILIVLAAWSILQRKESKSSSHRYDVPSRERRRSHSRSRHED